MILGHGTAETFEAIVAEYDQFLRDTGRAESSIYDDLKNIPQTCLRRIGKPFAEWTEEDIVALYHNRAKQSHYFYSAFLAFLLFRGYYRPTLNLLIALPSHLCRQHGHALAPYRQKIKETQEQLHYYVSSHVGSELNLLIWLLAITAKPLEQLTRADFDSFRDEYQAWYRGIKQPNAGRPDARLSRLERYLVHWDIIPEAKFIFRHEEHFARLRHEPIRQAILTHMQWCDVKYSPSTIHSRRAAVLGFFLWFQDHHPERSRLDSVTRPIALEYNQFLKNKVEEGTYSPKYRNDLYRGVRLFFDFVIDERLSTSPDRNPFARGDMPSDPDPVPRYLSDHHLRTVLEYCNNGATLKEKTIVTTLLHTGIRAAELATLQSQDIVQIQGKWKLHIREGKGLKDRVIPLTSQCLTILQAWQEDGWERVNDHLFTHHGCPYTSCNFVCDLVREMGRKLDIEGLTPHRFRHTFAVALLNYGIRESALQKLMGHKTLDMTLEYARILDHTVEQAFNEAVERMQTGPLSWIPSFFAPEDYTIFAEGDTVNWIRLPHGYCRRHHKLHCESDVKCLLCDRFCALPGDLPRLQEMRDRFLQLGMKVKAAVADFHIRLLDPGDDSLALEAAGLQCFHSLDQRCFPDEMTSVATD
jgi:integrase